MIIDIMTDVSIDDFKNDIRFKKKIEYIETIPAQKATYKKVDNLDKSIVKYLASKKISLYKHQAEAYEAVKDNKNIIITTPTASGKTLCFNLPILETLINDENATALYIYPAKALANDQLQILKEYEEDLNININPATYDGDTPRSKKYGIRNKSRIVLTNPYQLHHILAWHHQWEKFYSNLKYIVIDESHYYKGIFGSNVALLIRRLKRIVKHYGSNPQFILSSATLANPLELANRLTGEDFKLISQDGSPSGEKDFILYNPFKNYKPRKGKRDNAPNIHQETEFIFIYLLLKNIQTLCFTVSRKMAELIALWARRDMENYKKKLVHRIKAYRAGYRAKERREIEEGLKERRYLGVTTTNALELGINIGTLDAVIISGYPGTMVSVWQQGGRCGRSGNKSLVILVAFENQLDQYFMKNPEFFFEKPHENAIIDLKNDILLKSHIQCAANELRLSRDEIHDFSPELTNQEIAFIFKDLLRNKELAQNIAGEYYYPGHDSPSFKHSLDQLSKDVFRIMCGSKTIETMELAQVYSEAYEGAVLIHQSETYVVTNINFKTKIVNVVKQEVGYHTRVLKETDISIIKKLKRVKISNFTVNFGIIEVREDFNKYNKVHYSKIIGQYKLNLPPLRFKTKGLWFTIDEKIKDEVEDKFEGKDIFAGGLHGAEHALIGLFPLHTMCDRFDIGGLSTNIHPDTQEPTIFIYDAYEGGIGITEKAIDVFYDLVKSTMNLLDTCECEEGCPKCIYSPKCGNDNKPLNKDATKYILHWMYDKLSDNPNDITVYDNTKEESLIPRKVRKISKIKPKSTKSKGHKKPKKIKVKKDSKTVEDKYVEALDYCDDGNYGYAKDLLVEIINNDKNYSNAWYMLGNILNIQGDKQGAISFLKKAISINPAHEDANDLYLELTSK